VPRPARGFHALPLGGPQREAGAQYVAAQNAAANFAFANRLFLGLMAVRAIGEALGREVGARLVYDAPHNLVVPSDSPALDGQTCPNLPAGSVHLLSATNVGPIGPTQWPSRVAVLGDAMKPAPTKLFLALLPVLAACGGAATPTTVIGTWEVSSVDGAQGGTIPAKNVLQMELVDNGGVRLVSCRDPVFEGTTLFTCHEPLVCATGTYTYSNSVLSITQTGTTSTHAGTVAFAPGELVLGGEFFGPTYKAVHFSELAALSTSCLPLP